MVKFLYHWPIVILDGGFICVDTRLVDVFHDLYYNLVEKCLNQGIIDDDQFILTFLLTDHPHLFSVLKGDWFARTHGSTLTVTWKTQVPRNRLSTLIVVAAHHPDSSRDTQTRWHGRRQPRP
jgi:hypothetical protein